jgi:hypothetical protein
MVRQDHGIDYYGYIVLESRPADKVRKRQSDGAIPRKPPKGKRKIGEKNNRIIPIIDKDLFNNPVALYTRPTATAMAISTVNLCLTLANIPSSSRS